MSLVVAQPVSLAKAAREVYGAGSALAVCNAAAVTSAPGVVPAATDEVFAPTAAQIAMHARMYQPVSARAASVREVFTTTLAISAGSYAATEAVNAIAAG